MRRKETIPRALKDGTGRKLFLEKFGKPIEEYDCYKRAIEGLNKSTQRTYRRVLPYYFLFLGEDPDAVIANRKSDLTSFDVTDNERYERKTKAYIKTLVSKNLSISGHIGRIQGFFSNNSHRLSLDLRRLKYPKARKTRKFSPCNEDVRSLFAHADSARDKFIVAVIYQNGPAPVDVAALRVGDYPVEPWVYFEFSRSKTGEVWRGVSTPDVCDCLKAYVIVKKGKVMIKKGKVGEPLLVGREGPLDNQGVSQVVRELIIKAGFGSVEGFKPTSLRDAFEDALCDAEIYSKVKEALMGHTSSIEHEYGSQDKMEFRLIEAMKKVYPLLCLNDSNRVDGSMVGLTKDDIDNVKELIHVNDPEHLKGEDKNKDKK